VFRIFDRYLLKNFFVPFLYALFALIAIWLVYDLGDNGPDLADAQLPTQMILLFYARQLPYVIVTWLPLAVLLGLLYVLTRMSRRNEMVAMVSSGVSVARLLTPLILFGLIATGLCTYLNYELAPRGLYAESYMVDELAKGRSKTQLLEGHLFRNRREHRTWFIQRLNTKTEALRGVQVIQQDPNDLIQFKVYGASASFDSIRNVWTFYDGKIAFVDSSGNVTQEEFFEKKQFSGWGETPWRLGSAALRGRFMTVPELRHYLVANSDFPESALAEYQTQFWYRFALPWNVLIVILVAAPLCVVFSRRGALRGVATSLLMFVGLFASSNLFMALGQGDRVSPLVAAFTPTIGFFLIGVLVLWLRTSNRPIPGLA
jgi:lipopolysaccharide export system permease protein